MKSTTKKSTIWGYSIYGFGSNCLGGILGSFLMLYLTDNLMLSTAFIAGLMLVGRIANALSEFLMGIIIDRVSGKHGKARPWILVTSFFTALPVFMLFNTPSDLGDMGTKVWVVVTYLMHVAVFGSAISIAYSTLLVKIAKDPNTRVKMTNLSGLMGQIGGMLAASYGIPLLMYFGGYETGYRGMTLIFCIIGFAGMFLTGVICKEQPEEVSVVLQEEKEKLVSKKRKLPLKQQLGYIFKNRYALPLLLMFVLAWFGSTITKSITIYYLRDIMGNAGHMTWVSYARTLPAILIGLLGIVPLASSKLGKRTALTIGAAALTAGSGIMMFAPESFTLVLCGSILFGIGTTFAVALMKAVIADVADYVNKKNQIDVAGMVSSVAYMGMRIGTALGSVGLAILLDLGGYSGEAAKAGLAQPASMLTMEKMGYIYIPLICNVLLIGICQLMNVDKEVQKMDVERQEVKA